MNANTLRRMPRHLTDDELFHLTDRGLVEISDDTLAQRVELLFAEPQPGETLSQIEPLEAV